MLFFILILRPLSLFFFFFNDTATTEIYTLSLHDALPIWIARNSSIARPIVRRGGREPMLSQPSSRIGVACSKKFKNADRKSTRLNSSHVRISYAVFCLKKKKKESLVPDRTTTTNRRSLRE